jgi:hypothetical protein
MGGAEGRTARSEVKEEQRRGEKEKIYLWAAAEGRRSWSSRRSEVTEQQQEVGGRGNAGGRLLKSAKRRSEAAE